MYLMSKTFMVVSPTSSENGEYEDSGFEYDNEVFDNLEDLVEEIMSEGCVECSSTCTSKDEWFSTVDAEIDYENGYSTFYSFHPKVSSKKEFERLLVILNGRNL